jgi:hypothetical protein
VTYPADPSDPPRQPRFVPAPLGQQQAVARHASRPAVPERPQPEPPAARRPGLTAAEKFWYVLSCIAFGAGYFAKIPAKKAMEDFGLTELTGAEAFWYILMCIGFGGGYFAKLPTAKALSELEQFRPAGHARLEYR